jgi:hypothetical protein
MPVVHLTPEYNEQIKRTVRQVLREEHGGKPRPTNRYPVNMPWMWAIATAEISAASDGATSPTTGEVEILLRDSVSGNLERSGNTETATNRWEGVTIEQDTLLVIALLDGEFVVMAADCSAMASPPL